MSRETVTVTRDVEAVVVPAGDRILIPEGVEVTITQSLGGTFTVITPHGYMARVDGKDADALGKDPMPGAAVSATGPKPGAASDVGEVETQVWDALRQVYDPEIPINIVDLGLIYECKLVSDDGGVKVEIQMTMTAPGCGMGDVLRAEAESRIRDIPGVTGVQAEIVWDPPWDQSRMSEAARLELGFG